MLPDYETKDGHRSKHPQPVLENLLPSGLEEGTYSSQTSSPRRPLASNGSSLHNPDSGSDDDDGLHLPRANGRAHRRPNMSRATSEMSRRSLATRDSRTTDDGKDKDGKLRMRHGWEAQLESPEQANLLSQTFFMYFEDKRHETAGNPPPGFDPKNIVSE